MAPGFGYERMAVRGEDVPKEAREPLANRVGYLEKQVKEMNERLEELSAVAQQFAHELGLSR